MEESNEVWVTSMASSDIPMPMLYMYIARQTVLRLMAAWFIDSCKNIIHYHILADAAYTDQARLTLPRYKAEMIFRNRIRQHGVADHGVFTFIMCTVVMLNNGSWSAKG